MLGIPADVIARSAAAIYPSDAKQFMADIGGGWFLVNPPMRGTAPFQLLRKASETKSKRSAALESEGRDWGRLAAKVMRAKCVFQRSQR